MRLENVLALTHGLLINRPFVSSFTNTVFRSKDVRRGDIFMAFDDSEIENAIFNGAYAIIFDKPTQISDNEIAWIKVENVKDALKKLLRFRLIEKKVTVYECDEITLKLALQVITEPSFVVVNGDIQEISEVLWHLEEKTTLLFCPTLNDSDLFTKIESLPDKNIEKIKIVEKTLFETSFIYENVFYERQLISPFFTPYLENLLQLYKSLKIAYRLKKFTSLEHFEALFVNNNLEEKEFGTSDKVLIFEQNIALVKSEINFLHKEANWAKTIILIPFEYSELKNSYKNVFVFNNSIETIEILQKNDFHFALVVGVEKSILTKSAPKQKQLTLTF